MRTQIFQAAVLTMTLATAAHAQYGGAPRDWDRGFSRGDTRYGRATDPVSGSLRDLDNIFRRARVDHHEAGHFRNAIQELDRFQRQASRGRFDRGNLDRAIDNMRDLARADQLHPRDRQVIAARVQDLRYLRDRGDNGGFNDRGRW